MNQRFCNGMIHVIKKGDNLYQLSRQYRVPLALILRANPYVDVYNLQPGQEICIPVARRQPGMPMMKPQPRQMMENEPEQQENEEEEEEQMKEELDEMEAMRPEERKQEEPRTDIVYISDGTKSLGELLKEFDVLLSEFLGKNDLDHVIIAADVILYMPKKV